MRTDAEIRILGLALEDLASFSSRFSRNAGLFAALDRRFDVVGFVRPELPPLEDYLNKLRHFYPARAAWRGRAALNSWRFKRRTVIAERLLGQWDAKYDLILEVQTLFAPGRELPSAPYAVFTDNIYPLTERFYPAWAPLRPVEARRWEALEGEVCRQARTVFAMSDFLRSAMIEHYRCDPSRVVRVGGGANSFVRSLARRRYDAQVALFVGINFEIKGGRTLLAAWRHVHDVLPEAQLWIVGPRERLAEEQPGVHWLGFADREQLTDLYGRASVFVMPSNYEAWGHVFLEAMGHGLPCIASNSFAMPEIVTPGKTGLLVELGEVEPLAAALVGLLAHPERAEALGRRAHAEVLEQHTWDHVVERMTPAIRAISE
jgi:glycosyltransferase involved in cell wall biosynthesis